MACRLSSLTGSVANAQPTWFSHCVLHSTLQQWGEWCHLSSRCPLAWTNKAPLNVPLNVPPNANRARDENCEISAVRTLRGTLRGALKGALRGTLRGTLRGAFHTRCSPSSQKLATGSCRLRWCGVSKGPNEVVCGGNTSAWAGLWRFGLKNVLACVWRDFQTHNLFAKETCVFCSPVGQTIHTDRHCNAKLQKNRKGN